MLNWRNETHALPRGIIPKKSSAYQSFHWNQTIKKNIKEEYTQNNDITLLSNLYSLTCCEWFEEDNDNRLQWDLLWNLSMGTQHRVQKDHDNRYSVHVSDKNTGLDHKPRKHKSTKNAPTGIWTRVEGLRAPNAWPCYTIGAYFRLWDCYIYFFLFSIYGRLPSKYRNIFIQNNSAWYRDRTQPVISHCHQIQE